MKVISSLLIVCICLLSNQTMQGQEKLPTGQLRAEVLGFGIIDSYDPGFFMLGAGIGASARMWKYFSLNGALSYGQRDFTLSQGVLERSFTQLNLSADFYPATTYRGFYLGSFLSYTQIGNEAEEGLPLQVAAEEQSAYITLGFQFGFNAKLSPIIHLFTRVSLGLDFSDSDGVYNGVVGLAYVLK